MDAESYHQHLIEVSTEGKYFDVRICAPNGGLIQRMSIPQAQGFETARNAARAFIDERRRKEGQA